jgi:hypothetical protein
MTLVPLRDLAAGAERDISDRGFALSVLWSSVILMGSVMLLAKIRPSWVRTVNRILLRQPASLRT